MWMIEFKDEDYAKSYLRAWVREQGGFRAIKVWRKEEADVLPSKEGAESYLRNVRKYADQEPEFWDWATVVPADPEEKAVQVHAAELVEDDEDDTLRRTWHPPEEEPLENFVDRPETRVIRETHQLPCGFQLETEWYPEDRNVWWCFTLPMSNQWMDLSGVDGLGDRIPTRTLLEGRSDCDNADEARDYIRSVVTRFTEVLDD